jgi:hypothetical protein
MSQRSIFMNLYNKISYFQNVSQNQILILTLINEGQLVSELCSLIIER